MSRRRVLVIAAFIAVFTLSVASLPGGAGASAHIVRGPYLQMGTDTGVSVRWRTDVLADSRVRFGTDPENLGAATDDTQEVTEHEVRLDGLAPNSVYYYAVGRIGATDSVAPAGGFFVTAPLPGSRRPTRIWVVGDSGTGDQEPRATRDGYLAFTGPRYTDVWLMLGDMAYPSGGDGDYQHGLFDIFGDQLRSSVLWPTVGNHDVKSGNSARQRGAYYEAFTLPAQGEAGGVPSGTEAYYSFDYANVHFLSLNSYDVDRSPSGPMEQWLREDLGATTSDWTIALWHHAPYSRGRHDSDCDNRMRAMRENIVPILEDYGTDVVLGGHSHTYQRSMLIDGYYGPSPTLSDLMILNGGDGRSDGDGAYYKPTLGPGPHEGTVYVVAGAAAHSGPGNLDHPAMAVSTAQRGSLVLDVDGARLDATYVDQAGEVLDSFSIIKGVADPPPPPVSTAVVGGARQSCPNSGFLGCSVTGGTAEPAWPLAALAIGLGLISRRLRRARS